MEFLEWKLRLPYLGRYSYVFVQRREWVSAKQRRMFEECGFVAGGLTGKIAWCLGDTAKSRKEGGKDGRKEGGNE